MTNPSITFPRPTGSKKPQSPTTAHRPFRDHVADCNAAGVYDLSEILASFRAPVMAEAA